MAKVVVVGGYGSVGDPCVRELLETTDATVVVASHNGQRASTAALARGERAQSLYLDAADPRTMSNELAGVKALVCCTNGAPLVLLERALALRIPVVCLTSFHLDRHDRLNLAERAWEAEVPMVLFAGAAPGLSGVLADALLRRFAELDEVRIASSGPWMGSASAQSDVAALRARFKPALPRQSRRARSHWVFPDPIGRQFVRRTLSPELEDFAEAHCVEHLTYLEADEHMVARGVSRLLGRERSNAFALSAEAFLTPESEVADARIDLFDDDAPHLAALVAATIVRAVLHGKVPAGLLTPREAVNPGTLLETLRARGVEVSTET